MQELEHCAAREWHRRQQQAGEFGEEIVALPIWRAVPD
jgi:hypothetical protein